MEEEIAKVQSKNQVCEQQLDRCEEVLKDLTDKLAEKQKEVRLNSRFKMLHDFYPSSQENKPVRK